MANDNELNALFDKAAASSSAMASKLGTISSKLSDINKSTQATDKSTSKLTTSFKSVVKEAKDLNTELKEAIDKVDVLVMRTKDIKLSSGKSSGGKSGAASMPMPKGGGGAALGMLGGLGAAGVAIGATVGVVAAFSAAVIGTTAALSKMAIATAAVSEQNRLEGEKYGISASENKSVNDASQRLYGDDRLSGMMEAMRANSTDLSKSSAYATLGVNQSELQGMSSLEQMKVMMSAAKTKMSAAGNDPTAKAAYGDAISELGMNFEDLQQMDLSELDKTLSHFGEVNKGLDSKELQNLTKANQKFGDSLTKVTTDLSVRLAPSITKVVGQLVDYMESPNFQQGVDNVVWGFEKVMGLASGALNIASKIKIPSFENTWDGMVSSGKAAASKVGDWIKSTWESATTKVKGFVNNLVQSIKDLVDKIVNSAPFKAITAAGDFVGNTVDKVKDKANDLNPFSPDKKFSKAMGDGELSKKELKDLNGKKFSDNEAVIAAMKDAISSQQLNLTVNVDKSGNVEIIDQTGKRWKG